MCCGYCCVWVANWSDCIFVCVLQLDATLATPVEACQRGASVARMIRVLADTQVRTQRQEGRDYNINQPDHGTRQKPLHAAAWNGHGVCVARRAELIKELCVTHFSVLLVDCCSI